MVREDGTRVTARLDRLARSTKQLHHLVLEVLKQLGVHFRVTEQGIDTSTSAGLGMAHQLREELLVQVVQASCGAS